MPVQVPASARFGTHWITIDDRQNHAAAQTQFYVRTDWPQEGFGAEGRRFNAYENDIDSSNVSKLLRAWSMPAGGFSNASPFIEADNLVYVGDATNRIHAYLSNGSLYWNAVPGSDLESSTPAAGGGRVFFGAANGTVYAYPLRCRSDGGTCTPNWSRSIGTTVTGSLTFKNGKVYVPGNDGTIHVLDGVTGTPGTSIFGFSADAGPTTQVAFGPGGAFYYGQGSNYQERNQFGGTTKNLEAGAVSAPVAYNGRAYYTTAAGNVREVGGNSWNATLSAGCSAPPAVANNVLFAGCGSLTAYDAETGGVLWSVGGIGPVLGVTVASDVVYVCAGGGSAHVSAFSASRGARLWGGGYCATRPIVVNGTLYSTYAWLDAYDLTTALPARYGRRKTRRPDPAALRPDPRLHRHRRG
jgi:hypothetical protein